MPFRDPHDPRQFLRYAKCDASGAIVAMIEVAETAPLPVDAAGSLFVDISALGAIDLADQSLVESIAPLVEAYLAATVAAKTPPVLSSPVVVNGG